MGNLAEAQSIDVGSQDQLMSWCREEIGLESVAGPKSVEMPADVTRHRDTCLEFNLESDAMQSAGMCLLDEDGVELSRFGRVQKRASSAMHRAVVATTPHLKRTLISTVAAAIPTSMELFAVQELIRA